VIKTGVTKVERGVKTLGEMRGKKNSVALGSSVLGVSGVN
jgi:hypothetical protein